jgi:hypothetical protein
VRTNWGECSLVGIDPLGLLLFQGTSTRVIDEQEQWSSLKTLGARKNNPVDSGADEPGLNS